MDFILVLKLNDDLLGLHRELLTAWCRFTATASQCKF